MLEVTITATRRPKILRTTLESFDRNLLCQYHKKRAIINVDPVGEDVDSRRLVDVCHEFFEEVVFNLPQSPSFPKAFKWVWAQVTADWVFHLEDDWELLREVSLDGLGTILSQDKMLVYLRLPQFHAYQDYMKNWNKIFRWNGVYYEPPVGEAWLGFSGHPALIKGDFVKTIVPMLDVSLNPEKQINRGTNPAIKEYFSLWQYGVYGEPSKEGTPPLIKDIGREWARAAGWRKAGNKAFFTVWERAQ